MLSLSNWRGLVATLEANREFDDNSTGQGKQSTELKNKKIHDVIVSLKNVLNNAGIIIFNLLCKLWELKKIEKKKYFFTNKVDALHSLQTSK